jgi:hypothetical protein
MTTLISSGTSRPDGTRLSAMGGSAAVFGGREEYAKAGRLASAARYVPAELRLGNLPFPGVAASIFGRGFSRTSRIAAAE